MIPMSMDNIEKKEEMLEDSERQSFRISILLYCVLALASAVYNLAVGKGWISVLAALGATVFGAVCFFLLHSKRCGARIYPYFAVLAACVLSPAVFLLCGGFHSGAIAVCPASVLLCVFCKGKRQKGLIAAAIFCNLAVLLAAFCVPSMVIPIPEALETADLLVMGTTVGIAVILLVASLYSGLQRSENARVLLAQHIDSQVVSFMTEKEAALLGTEKKQKVCVMFVDITNFTGISETMPTELVSEFLNVFFRVCDDCIHENDGILDKYIGDCAMAYWIDRGDGESVRKACRTADEIRQSLKKRSEEIYSRFKCDLECGIGINYGEAIVGEVGSEMHKDFTVIGDCVNVASRLESIAPGGIIYLSREAAMQVSHCINIAKVPKQVVLKGKNIPVDIYTLVDLSMPEREIPVTPWAPMTGYLMHVCGSRGSYSLAGRRYYEYGGETSCYILKKDNYALILDCGTGLQRAREIIADCTKIDVVLTHVHYDHIIGLLDWSIFPPTADLTFYGNFDNWLGENTIHELLKAPYWPVDISRGSMISVKTMTDYCLNREIHVMFYPASHPNNANLVVLDICDKRICLMADCENPKDLPPEVVHGCDMLMYDGMYEDQYYHEHVGWGHSTWESGVRLAMEAKVHRLVITHHSPRNSDEKLHGLELEAQELFPATTFAKAGDRFII